MKLKKPPVLGQLSDVDLRLLRVFKAVADCGGMAAAEVELNVAMSTISRHVKDLELRLGLVLCRRGRAGFELTPEGERVYAAADALLGATNGFRDTVHDIHQHLDGDLHVAVFEKTITNPQAHIAEGIGLFKQLAPKVSVHLHLGTIGMIERGVRDGRYHLGIVPDHRLSTAFADDPLFDEVMHLYAGVSHPWFQGSDAKRGWAALRSQQLAGLDYHSPNMVFTHKQRLERGATASDQEAVAMLVISGAYLGFLPNHYAELFVRAGQMRAVAPRTLTYRCTFSCIWRKAPSPKRVALAFHDCLLEAHGAR
jgi:DNA-binding transcriptional LysR family regulator